MEKTPELHLLNRLAGKWKTTGKLGKEATTNNIEGTDTYEWIPGGFFLLHTVDVIMDGERKQSIEVIGYDLLSGTYPMHFYDDIGESGGMSGSFDGDKWTISSPEMRFHGAFTQNDQVLSGTWERYVGSSWRYLMDIRLEKMQ
ncbi:DUF1579 family protein [Dyadobacter sp. Leaf189]|uniref:DUF1579 family protein n=1 Tax=Dyadobacter sp. Leaf189 TaxID=1736295 RepID=UPI0006F611C0|nr:DUF1579 family protein [Dyadobacter sp. Leaf189]KQS28025.1 hypothetical protein ASG33_16685 [Dyadobacter sp. Leaf189]